MNTNATLEKLGQMRLHGFEKAYAEIINNARPLALRYKSNNVSCL